MKLQSMLPAIAGTLAIFFTACSGKKGIPVPADASVVIHLDGASLNSKLSWEEIKQGDLFKIALEKTNDSLTRKILDNPEESGIDIKSDAYMFVKAQGRGGYNAIILALKDEEKFNAFIGKISAGHPPVKEDGLTVIKKEHEVLTWNSKQFIFISNDNEAGGTNTNMIGKRRFSETRSFPADSLLLFARNLYNLKSDQSITSNKKFNSILKEKGDLHLWFNGSSMGSSLPAMITMTTKAGILFKDNYSGATLNFDDGKITIDAKQFTNKELAALYKKYSMKNLDESLLKKIPGNVAAAFAMNYPPEGLKEFLVLLGVDGLLNLALAETGFSLNDFVAANKGDILFAVSDFSYAPKQPTPGAGKDDIGPARPVLDAKLLFAASINDRPSFDKLLNALQNQVNKLGDGEISSFINKIPYQVKDNWFITGNDSTYVSSFGTGSSDHAFISKISGHPAGGYVDIRKFLAGARPGLAADSVALLIADESAKYWEDIVFHGGEFKNDATISHMEINLADKKTNSLKQLNTYFSFIARTVEENRKKRMAEWEKNPDTVKVEELKGVQKR